MQIQINPRKLALVLLLASIPTQTYSSSWFASDPAPAPYPSAFSQWTSDQYQSFENSMSSVRDSTFDAWDESRLREWLLEQGIVAPKGPREEIVLAAKRRYRDWQDAKSQFDDTASSIGSSASSAVSSVMSQASSTVATTASSASSAVASFAAQATAELPQHPLDDTKDYVWSTWDETQLRKYLVQKGVIDDRTAAGKKRDELITYLKEGYTNAEGSVWEVWSDSYIREWLASHNLIDNRSPIEKSRDEYLDLMRTYYYNHSQRVWDTWSESDMKAWLVENGIIKSDAEVKKEKMRKLVQDNYVHAQSTLSSAWTESQMRSWLIEKGYLRSDAQVKRDELAKLFQTKYSAASAAIVPYFVWPDARLRAYLREHSLMFSPSSPFTSSSSSSQQTFSLPKSRADLLQETRIKWVQTTSAAERIVNKIKEILDDNLIGPVEDQLNRLWEMAAGTRKNTEGYANEKYVQGKHFPDQKGDDASGAFEEKKSKAYAKVNGEM
ncbi:hypothetical protein GGU11DRAFT_574870 [Lentinula aff. detonsa]|uniref:Uncharacterized protein n=1 Tax=Lentinula aff. detonsa TaxID=2804958 RepID=A0AA38KNK2_9AGAR|nr:hypothetical protein GGU10DRAFT_52954 [Lentinula aff. detonsa]KAJ3798542.1 hypothetical protein GGU11DRAFT_574870 [Lentinula aff. detonsa]